MDDKFWRDLHKQFEGKDFKNEKEINKFIEGLLSKEIPQLSKDDMTDEELARELIFEARGGTEKMKVEAIHHAISIDPQCIDAYELFGDITEFQEIAICFYKRGVDIGKKIFGGAYLEERSGKFWGFHETRPFMRCMFGYASCLYDIGDQVEAITILEEMIVLNPNDNQGVRDLLMLYLIELNEFDKYRAYARQFEEDGMAFALFNRALFSYKTEGENDISGKALKDAMNQNKFVVAKLVSAKPIDTLPAFYGIGDNNEALYYAAHAQDVWHETSGAIAWLKKHAKKK